MATCGKYKKMNKMLGKNGIDVQPELVVMLTHHDYTADNAMELFEQCKDSKARYWGFKEQPLPMEQMRELYGKMKRCRKTTFMEVVAYSETEGIEGARIAVECGCDILMGTSFSPSILKFCQNNGLKYMPFVGQIVDRPSILSGSIQDMVDEALSYVKKGVYGIDLLGYRYTGDAYNLISTFVKNVPAPVCVAGSIDSWQKLDEVKQVAPWAFTIGSAFFEQKFGDTFAEQIDKVCDYMKR